MSIEPLRFVKDHLSEIVDRVDAHQERITITRNGRPVAVLIDVDDLESLEETVAILSDPAAMERLAESERALAAGDAVRLDELNELFASRRRAG